MQSLFFFIAMSIQIKGKSSYLISSMYREKLKLVEIYVSVVILIFKASVQITSNSLNDSQLSCQILKFTIDQLKILCFYKKQTRTKTSINLH